jgi:hypothetical protein
MLSPFGISPESLDAYEAITQGPAELVDQGYRGYLQSQGLKMQGNETVGDLAQNAIDPEGKSLIPFRTLANVARDPLTWAATVGPAKAIGAVDEGIPNSIYKPISRVFPWVEQADRAKMAVKAIVKGAPPSGEMTVASPLKGGKGFTFNPVMDKYARKESYKSGFTPDRRIKIGSDVGLPEFLKGMPDFLPQIKPTIAKPDWAMKPVSEPTLADIARSMDIVF